MTKTSKDITQRQEPEDVVKSFAEDENLWSKWSEDARDFMAKPSVLQLVDFKRMPRTKSGAAGRRNYSPGESDIKLLTINQNMPLIHRGARDFSECAYGGVEKNVEVIRMVFGSLFYEQAELFVNCLLAGLFYEQGLLEKAHKHAALAAVEIRPDFFTESKFCAAAIFVNILDALEQEDKAEQFLEDMEYRQGKDMAYCLDYNLRALKVRRRLYKGDTGAASLWLERHKPPLVGSVNFCGLYVCVTTARAYMADGKLDFAIALLKNILELSKKYNRPLDIIEVNILLSIAYWKKKSGYQEEALSHLETAVAEAHNYGFVQAFINEGNEIKTMLVRLQKKLEQPVYGGLIPSNFVKYIRLKISER